MLQPINLLPENGKLSHYRLELIQLSYGGKDIDKILNLKKTIQVANVIAKRANHTFQNLKPFSRYVVFIKAVNNHQQSSRNTSIHVNTEASGIYEIQLPFTLYFIRSTADVFHVSFILSYSVVRRSLLMVQRAAGYILYLVYYYLNLTFSSSPSSRTCRCHRRAHTIHFYRVNMERTFFRISKWYNHRVSTEMEKTRCAQKDYTFCNCL